MHEEFNDVYVCTMGSLFWAFTGSDSPSRGRPFPRRDGSFPAALLLNLDIFEPGDPAVGNSNTQ